MEAHDFPPFSLVTASSEALLAGCEEPGEVDFSGGVFAQAVPVGTPEVDVISVLLTSRESMTDEVPARIFRGGFVGGNEELISNRPLAETVLPWKGEGSQWVRFPVHLTPMAGMKVGDYIRLELSLPPGIGWIRSRHPDRALPGRAGDMSSKNRLTFCFRVDPPQPCYWPSNVLAAGQNGNRFTGVWKANPDLPQWLEISWRDPHYLREIELGFSDTAGFPVAYRLVIASTTIGQEIEQVEKGNREPAVCHRFDPPVVADSARFEFLSLREEAPVSVCRVQAKMWRRDV